MEGKNNRVIMLRYNDGRDIREELLQNTAENEYKSQPVCQAMINALINDEPIQILIDTGAVSNVMSVDLYNHLNGKQKLPTLPVSNCTLSGAIGSHSVHIKAQTRVEIIIEGRQACKPNINESIKLQCTFLLSPKLSMPCIWGWDFLRDKFMIIDLREGVCRLFHEDKWIIIKLIRRVELNRKFCQRIYCDTVALKIPFIQDEYLINSLSIDDVTSISDQIQTKVSESEYLTDSQRLGLKQVLEKYVEVFDRKPGVIKDYEYQMDVYPHQTYCRASYSVPWSKKEAVSKEIKKMLDWGIIEHSNSPYSSPIIAVMKADNSVRLVLDARDINKIIKPVRTRPEKLEELIQSFHGVKYLSSLDLRSSYWQIKLAPESRKYTAFIFAGRSFHFRVMPFGLNISGGVFIDALDRVLGPDLLQKVKVYVDDLLIATTTWEEHLMIIQEVLDKFKEYGVTVNLEKSKFGRMKIKFLGHIISPEGIIPNPKKLDVIKNFPYPRNKRELKGFLGLITFFNRFLPWDIMNIDILLNLLRKNVPWKWTTECCAVYDNIKNALANAELLSHPDMQKDFCLATDASENGLGAVLFQTNNPEDTGNIKLISFASRCLKHCERSYTTTELEILAVVWALKKFRYFVFGKKITVYCDHKAVSFLMSCKLLHLRLIRWALLLQEYQIDIKYIKGKDNIIADILSRLPKGTALNEEIVDTSNCRVMNLNATIDKNFMCLCNNLPALQRRDLRWNSIISKLQQGENNSILVKYKIINDVLYCKNDPHNIWKLCIPDDYFNTVGWYTHLRWNHISASKCADKLGQFCYIFNMRHRLHLLLRKCLLCQKSKCINYSSKMCLQSIIPSKPLELVSCDIIGCLPVAKGRFRYIVAFYDVFSKYLKMYPVRSTMAKSIFKCLADRYVHEIGTPDTVLTDNASYFTSTVWRNGLTNLGIRQIFTSRYHPEASPVERVFREFNRYMRTFIPTQQYRWIEHVALFEKYFNNIPNSSTKYTPSEIMFNTAEPNDWLSPLPVLNKILPGRDSLIDVVRHNLECAARKRKNKFDKNLRQSVTYNIGDKILLKRHNRSSKIRKSIGKWCRLYEGPYYIFRIPHKGSYLLTKDVVGNNVKGLYPHKVLKRFYE